MQINKMNHINYISLRFLTSIQLILADILYKISMTQESKPRLPTFSQKYALRFYSFLIPQAIMMFIILRTHSATLALSFSSFYNSIGNFIPIKAHEQKNIGKIQNNNKFILGPLIVSCISTPVIILIIWRNYEDIIESQGIFSTIALLFAIGFTISGSIDASHELLHRTEPICKFFSYLNLFFMQFTIYPTQHLYLHHKKVGTLQDPITAPKNKTLYSYYINALFSCYKFNFNYSKKIFLFNITCTLLYNALLFALAAKEGNNWHKAVFFVVLSYATLFIMEGVEYIQHYGLVYRTDEKAKPVTQICSWNTKQNQLLNWYIFRFQRHSDHHMNAYKIYSTLDLTSKMPQFPFDFVSGIVMATIPPLWFKLLNPLADQIVQGKSVSQQHRALVNKAFLTLNVILLALFPIRVMQYLMVA